MNVYLWAGARFGRRRVVMMAETIGTNTELRCAQPYTDLGARYDWGSGSAGALALARRILLLSVGEQPDMRRLCELFAEGPMSGWGPSWAITSEQVSDWVAESLLLWLDNSVLSGREGRTNG